MKAYFDPCEICDARTGTQIMTGTMFGDVWICEQCAGGDDVKTPESLEKTAPSAKAPTVETPLTSAPAAISECNEANEDGGGHALSDEFFDDDKSEDEEQYPEPSPQTGFV